VTTIHAYPVQVLEDGGRVFVRRGRVQIKIAGDGVADLVRRLLARLSSGDHTAEQLLGGFAESERDAVKRLVDELLARRLLYRRDAGEPEPGQRLPEDPIDVFYWHFGLRQADVVARLGDVPLAILGVNEISRHLSLSLAAAGFDNFSIVDSPPLRNGAMFAVDALIPDRWNPAKTPISLTSWTGSVEAVPPACVIATDDAGDQQELRQWNRFCIDRGIYFLPVLLLDLLAYIGPFTVPGETACYECLRARQFANAADPEAAFVIEQARAGGRHIVGFHSLMAQLAAGVAAMELLKFYAGIPRSRTGNVIELSCLAGTMVPRKILKVPRCPACSNLNRRPAVALEPAFYPRLHDTI
jgi:bacteriocin biosynthesis cyclodehydratase domain-containing protein